MTEGQQTFFEWEDANPLLKSIPLDLTFEAVGHLLEHDPRLLWKGLEPPHSRLPRLFRKIDQLFVPTKIMIDFSLQFLGLLIQGLEMRDPRIAKNRAQLYETGRFKGMKLSQLPWLTEMAGGMVLEGMTGVCKSAVVRRIVQFLPQVVTHEPSDVYGWGAEFKQLVYLVVPMPASARLGPFLMEVVMKMDAVLGTSYAESYSGTKLSDDKRAVLVLHWLSLHRCGMLIIEECQERNLPQQVFGSDFLSLFLRAMNLGIPLCVVGNPKALTTIRTFTQDQRRFSIGHWFTFEPVWDFRSSVWRKDFVPSIWGWNPVQAEDQHIPNLEYYLWKKTGGVPGFLAILRKESLMLAWRAGRRHVEQADIEGAYKGRAMSGQHKLIEALTTFDAGLLAALTDFPADAIVARWQELGFLQPPERDQSSPAAEEAPSSEAAATPAASPKDKRARKPSGDKSLGVASARSELNVDDAGEQQASTGDSPAPNDTARQAPANVRPKGEAAPAAPPPHHASDQHLDRRSDAYKRLLGSLANQGR